MALSPRARRSNRSMGRRLAKNWQGQNRLSGLRGLTSQGFTGGGYTGTGQNIADLSGETYTAKGGEVYDPVAGMTWQEQQGLPTSPAAVPTTGTGIDTSGGLGTGGDVATGGFAGGLQTGLKDSGYFQSPEFGAQLGTFNENQLRQSYQDTFGRPIDDAALKFYMDKMAQGATLDQIMGELRASTEGSKFTSPYEQLITNTFQTELGRPVDPEAMQFYLNQLESGAITEQEFRDQIGASTEGQGYVTPTEQQTLTGQTGVVTAAQQSEEKSVGAIEEGLDATLGAYQEAGDVYDPYYKSGVEADKLQADLSGANGPEAQARAFAEFRDSPGQEYLRDQAEKARVRQAAATGGLAGGALQADLQAEAIGLAEQAYQQRFTDLGTIADRGMVAAKGTADQLSKGGDATFLAGQEKARAYQNAGNQIAYGAIAGAQLIDGALAEEGSALANLQLDAATAIQDMINQSGKGFDALIQGLTQGNQADLALVWGMLSKLSTEEINAAMQGVQSGAASTTESTNMLAQLLEAAGVGMSIYGEAQNASTTTTEAA